MPINRATFFFEDSNKHGWSETIHSTKSDLTSTMAAARALALLRRDLLGTTAFLTYIRVSDDLVKRDSLIYPVPTGDQEGRTSSEIGADLANVSIVTRLSATPITRRTLYLRGLPDECVTRSGRFTPTPTWLNRFDRWANELILNGWACRSRDGTSPLHPIFDVTQVAATGIVTITSTEAHGITLLTPFVIRGCRGCPQVNGTWTPLTVPSATTLTIKMNTLLLPYGGGGTVALLSYVLTNINDVKTIRASTRKTGSPFDRPLGRRRARTRR